MLKLFVQQRERSSDFMRLSRHAKNNIKLYDIEEDDIRKTIELPDIIDKEGIKTVVIKKFGGKYSGYPLKVVYEKIEEDLFIITTYPLKKKLWG